VQRLSSATQSLGERNGGTVQSQFVVQRQRADESASIIKSEHGILASHSGLARTVNREEKRLEGASKNAPISG